MFPHLPDVFDLNLVSPQIVQGSQILNGIYTNAEAVLQSGNLNSHRARFHINTIVNEAFPLIVSMEALEGAEWLHTWLNTCMNLYVSMLAQLSDVDDRENSRYDLWSIGDRKVFKGLQFLTPGCNP